MIDRIIILSYYSSFSAFKTNSYQYFNKLNNINNLNYSRELKKYFVDNSDLSVVGIWTKREFENLNDLVVFITFAVFPDNKSRLLAQLKFSELIDVEKYVIDLFEDWVKNPEIQKELLKSESKNFS